jgi:hypothetical protein
MPHPDKPLECIMLGDLAINLIDNAVEDLDLQGQSYLMFSLVAKPLDQFGAPKLLKILDAVRAQDISASVGKHLKSKPFGVLCAAIPSLCQLGSCDDATSGCLTCCSALASMVRITSGPTRFHPIWSWIYLSPGHTGSCLPQSGTASSWLIQSIILDSCL